MPFHDRPVEVIVALKSGQKVTTTVTVTMFEGLPFDFQLRLIETRNTLDLYTKNRRELEMPDLNIADLDSVLTPENYKVVRLKAQITALESALAKEREETRQRLRNDYEAARRREALLSSAYQHQSEVASDLFRSKSSLRSGMKPIARRKRASP